MLVRTLHFFWLLSVAALFVVAVVIAAGRLWVPTLAEYRAEVEALAGGILQKTVTIGRIEGTWRGLSPLLKLRDVSITEPGQPAALLAIGEIQVGIDVKSYLHERRLSLGSIDVIGADVTVVRDPEGNFHINSMTHESGDDASLAALFDIDRLSIHESVITYEDQRAERYPVRFSEVTLVLDNEDEQPFLSGYAMLPPQLGHRLDVAAKIRNTGSDPGQWGGRFYLQGHALKVSQDNPPVGARMPLAPIPALTQAEQDLIRTWIGEGAEDN